MLVQYIRDENNVPFGVVVAIERGAVGVSLCSPKDRFDRKLGKKIAAGRAEYMTYTPVPKYREEVVNNTIRYVMDRAERYFK